MRSQIAFQLEFTSELIIMILPGVFGLIICTCLISGFQIEFDRVEGEHEDDFFDISNLRIKRKQRGEYALDGAIIIKIDLDKSIMVDLKLSYSPTGSSKYTLLPMKIPVINSCDCLNTFYKKYLMEEMAKISDLPYIGDEYYCPLKAGTYNVDMYQLKADNFKWANRGYYRAAIHFNSTQDERKAVLNFYAKVSD